MKASAIPNHESTFQSTGLDCRGNKFILTEKIFIKGTDETIQIIDCAHENGDKSSFYPEESAKRKTALHFSMRLLKLIKFLCAKYAIPKNFLNEPEVYEIMTEPRFKIFSEIVSLVNCRTDKVDIGHAFDWAKIISRVNS